MLTIELKDFDNGEEDKVISYTDTEYLEIPSTIISDEYYINMMIAWFFATALSKQWDDSIKYIENKKLTFSNESIKDIVNFDVNYSSYLVEEGDKTKSSNDFIKVLDYNKKITNRDNESYTCTKVYNKPIFNKKYTL